jgi:hypothetical protein
MPRSLLDEGGADAWAKKLDAFWQPARDLFEYAEILAAFHQHVTSYRARKQLAYFHLSRKDIAELLNERVETLRRKLRGETWATTGDLALWHVALELDTVELDVPVPATPPTRSAPHTYSSVLPERRGIPPDQIPRLDDIL